MKESADRLSALAAPALFCLRMGSKAGMSPARKATVRPDIRAMAGSRSYAFVSCACACGRWEEEVGERGYVSGCDLYSRYMYGRNRERRGKAGMFVC